MSAWFVFRSLVANFKSDNRFRCWVSTFPSADRLPVVRVLPTFVGSPAPGTWIFGPLCRDPSWGIVGTIVGIIVAGSQDGRNFGEQTNLVTWTFGPLCTDPILGMGVATAQLRIWLHFRCFCIMTGYKKVKPKRIIPEYSGYTICRKGLTKMKIWWNQWLCVPLLLLLLQMAYMPWSWPYLLFSRRCMLPGHKSKRQMASLQSTVQEIVTELQRCFRVFLGRDSSQDTQNHTTISVHSDFQSAYQKLCTCMHTFINVSSCHSNKNRLWRSFRLELINSDLSICVHFRCFALWPDDNIKPKRIIPEYSGHSLS